MLKILCILVGVIIIHETPCIFNSTHQHFLSWFLFAVVNSNG